jgi:glycerophosphoryl diester phosphodiesterase
MVEVDVRLSGDGRAVIFHDETIGRTTRAPVGLRRRFAPRTRLWELPLAEIRRLDAGAWFHRRFAGTTVPTLDEVVSACAGRLGLNLELKPDRRSTGTSRARLVAALSPIIASHPEPDALLFSSFDHESLTELRRGHPAARIGLLLTRDQVATRRRFVESFKTASMLSAVSINLPSAAVTPAVVETVLREGYAIYVYTVNAPAALRRLIAAGVDGIFTDYPARMRGLVLGQ